MDNIKLWKDGNRLVIVIENCKMETQDLILNMVKTGINSNETGLVPDNTEVQPVIKMPVYVKNSCRQPGIFLFVPEGKVYLDNIRGLPNEADIIIKALKETNSSYQPSLDAFAKRLKEIMTDIIQKTPLQEVLCRYEEYIDGILSPIYCENMCGSLWELQKTMTEQELKNIIISRL